MPSRNQSPVTRATSCLCGSVQVSLTGTDKGAVLCHCVNCKKASGSAFAHNHRFTNATLTFIKGQELCKNYPDGATKSGNILGRHFCSSCGSPIYLTNPKIKGLYILHSGGLDDGQTQPFTELFLDDKYTWIGTVTQKGKL